MASVVTGGDHRTEPKASAPERRASAPVREPEVAELRAFCTAAKLGSIAEAARTLHVSQPALSKRLRTLETVVGAQLFRRSTRGVTLTQAGAQLYGAAQRLLASADTVRAVMRRPAQVMPVRMAATPAVAAHRLPAVLVEIALHEEWLEIEMVTANSPAVRDLVRDGRADLGIAAVDPDRPPDEALSEKTIWHDEVVVVVPDAHPWARLDEIPLEEFAATPLVQPDPWSNSSRVVAAALDHAGLERATPIASIGSADAVLAVSAATGHPAVLSRLVAEARVGVGTSIRLVAGLRLERELALVWVGPLLDLPRPVYAVAQHLVDLPFARSRRAGREFRLETS